MKNIQNIM